MLFSSFPHKSQPWRLRVVKEEDRFIKELGLIEDISVESRRSSLNRVRLSTTLFQTGVSMINSQLPERSSETSEDKWEISYGILPEKPEIERLR